MLTNFFNSIELELENAWTVAHIAERLELCLDDMPGMYRTLANSFWLVSLAGYSQYQTNLSQIGDADFVKKVCHLLTDRDYRSGLVASAQAQESYSHLDQARLSVESFNPTLCASLAKRLQALTQP